MSDNNQSDKAIRLLSYLKRLALLRSSPIRDMSHYPIVIGINDIPKLKGCYTKAWGEDLEYELDIWAEVQIRNEPPIPAIPVECEEWIINETLRNTSAVPGLLQEITVADENPFAGDQSVNSEEFYHQEKLSDYPIVLEKWRRYIEDSWTPWKEKHIEWESINKVYSKLHALYQQLLKLGERYELVLAFGLLNWQTPGGQIVKRHVLVADAMLEFEANLGRFTIKPGIDGANLRLELDMLESGDQPATLESDIESLLKNAADDPWEKSIIDTVLQSIAHSLNPTGEYSNTLANSNLKATPKLVIEYAPAIILRERSEKGLIQVLDGIEAEIKAGGEIPILFQDLAEINKAGGNQPKQENDKESKPGVVPEVYFPKPWNEQQRQILDRLEGSNASVVTGPPGTGKSHTIANLICHLLATGNRLLVTAKTPRALQVLMGDDENKEKENKTVEKEAGLIPKQIRPLCISLLGSGLREKASIEASVKGIQDKKQDWNDGEAESELTKLEQKLTKLRKEYSELNSRFFLIRESEIYKQSIAQGKYRGTASEIARSVERDRESYNWLIDEVPLDQDCPVSPDDLQRIREGLLQFPAEIRFELALPRPRKVPNPEQISILIKKENELLKSIQRLRETATERTCDLISKMEEKGISELLVKLNEYLIKLREVQKLSFTWLRDAVKEIINGKGGLWSEILVVTKKLVSINPSEVELADNTNIHFPEGVKEKELFEETGKLKEFLDKRGRLGWGVFRPKIVKENKRVLRTKLNGHFCSTLKDINRLHRVLYVRLEFDKTWEYWAGRTKRVQGPKKLQFQEFRSYVDLLESIFRLQELCRDCQSLFRNHYISVYPDWINETEIEEWISSFGLSFHQKELNTIRLEIDKIASDFTKIKKEAKYHPLTDELLKSVQSREPVSYKVLWGKVQDLEKKSLVLIGLDEAFVDLSRHLPSLAKTMKESMGDEHWEERIRKLHNAWAWAQAKHWIEIYITKDDLPSIHKRIAQLRKETGVTIAEIASKRAWKYCFSKLTEDQGRHMKAWSLSMRKLGKGTGKHAFRHRKDAQDHLEKCRDAVPA